MESRVSKEPINILADIVKNAKKSGADSADAVFVSGRSSSINYRLGKVENIESSNGQDLGLRVIIGKKQAVVSSSDQSTPILNELVERAINMAKTIPEDQYVGLADPSQITTTPTHLDMSDPSEITTGQLIETAKECEDAARSIDGITNSDGSNASWGRVNTCVYSSNGFSNFYESTGGSFSASVLAGNTHSGMETDYDYSSAVYFNDLESPQLIGKSAGQRAIKKLGARKIKSGVFPIIFEPRTARGILNHFLNAINGNAIARGTSFLQDSMEQSVFNEGISISEDPHLQRGLRSKPCDAEGLPTKQHQLVEKGVLKTWILDLHSARQLKLEPTGHAARGTSAPPFPAVTNVQINAGLMTHNEMISEIQEGILVTEAFGQGVNNVTGDYSRGIAGFWIENGEIKYPVSEITAAGNLKNMFHNTIAANNLEIKYGIDSPTLRIDGMSIAGN